MIFKPAQSICLGFNISKQNSKPSYKVCLTANAIVNMKLSFSIEWAVGNFNAKTICELIDRSTDRKKK